jgi:hypothetical protein
VDEDVTSVLLAGLLVLVMAVRLAYVARATRNKARRLHEANAAAIAAVVDGVAKGADVTAGVSTWTGSWDGRRVQIRTIVDTLATRKLPAYWLSVSVTERTVMPGVFDMMMRPGSPTTFSNFDLLDHTLPTPAGFPAEAVVRTDRGGVRFPGDIIAGHLDVFSNPRAKELLVTPNGVRIVWLLAEADRARYGVFRQAEFGGAALDPALIGRLLASASSLHDAINRSERQAA